MDTLVAYSFTKQTDPTKSARVYGKDLRISPKHATEISREIRGMKLEAATLFMEEAMETQRPVAFKRHNRKVGHRHGLVGWDAGRYPVKASSHFLKLLKELQANAEYKGLDVDRLRIIHAASYRSRVIPGFVPRAYGRGTPYNQVLTNIELVVEER
jgi:large subunit ribosomal protein L22